MEGCKADWFKSLNSLGGYTSLSCSLQLDLHQINMAIKIVSRQKPSISSYGDDEHNTNKNYNSVICTQW